MQMPDVAIFPPVVSKTICVKFFAPGGNQPGKAILLGASGERLHTYPLTEAENELSLDGYAAGAYTLRIEAGNEVIVRQIIIRS